MLRFKKSLKFIVIGLVAFTLAACGRFWYQKREAWRDDLESRCMRSGLVEMSQYVKRAPKIDGPGICGMNQPLKVAAALKGSVEIKPQATLACPIVSTLDSWIYHSVQPAAYKWLGAYVVEVKAGSYACRTMNHKSNAKLSEHSYGNALDIFGFVLSDGRTVTIAKGWNGDNQEQVFLREIFTGACDLFTTVLGPGFNALHYDHFHVDLAKHNKDFTKRVCNPKPDSLAKPLVIKG